MNVHDAIDYLKTITFMTAWKFKYAPVDGTNDVQMDLYYPVRDSSVAHRAFGYPREITGEWNERITVTPDTTTGELFRGFMAATLTAMIHEWSEFGRVGDDGFAPLHAHQQSGHDNWHMYGRDILADAAARTDLYLANEPAVAAVRLAAAQVAELEAAYPA